jgi:hypothetical protein
MTESDIIVLGPPPARRRQWRWSWAAAVLGLVASGVAAAYIGQAHRETVKPPAATAHRSSPQVVVYGYGSSSGGDQQSFSLNLRNLGLAEANLSAAVISPTQGVTIVSMGFAAEWDPGSAVSPALVVPAEGTALLVVQYTVDCAAVRSPWPYLGDIWVQVADTDASTSQRTRLQPPDITPAGQPSPLPCAEPNA